MRHVVDAQEPDSAGLKGGRETGALRGTSIFVLLICGLVGLMFVSGVYLGSYVQATKGGLAPPTQSLGIEGVATIEVVGPQGQIVGTWHAHNSLVTSGINSIVECLQSGSCPFNLQGHTITDTIGVAIGTCTDAFESSCKILSPAQSSLVKNSGCGTVFLTCTGWDESATFSSAVLNCATSCSVNDIAAGTTLGSLQFDDIPSSNFPSPITISAGDSLAITIQFTVS